MSIKRLMLLSFLISSSFMMNAFALTENLDQLIQEKNIIMPDLAATYPDADAVIILDEKAIDQSRIINPVYITRHVVVKIMKEAAVEKFKTVKIPIYMENKVTDIQARTINDGQISKVSDIPERDVDLTNADTDFVYPLEQGNTLFLLRREELNTEQAAGDLLKVSENPVLHDKRTNAYKIRQIDFPNVKVGSVVEYEYKIEQKRAVLYDQYYFMQNYPVLKAEYSMRNSKMLHFSFELSNFTTKPTIARENQFTNLDNQYNTDVRTKQRTVDVSDNPDRWQLFGHEYFDISLDTLPAYPANIPYIPSYPDYAPRLDVFMREAINLIKWSDVEYRMRPVFFSMSWNHVLHRMTTNYLVKDSQSREAKSEIGKVIAGATTPEAKVSAAVDWARKNLKFIPEIDRWNSYYWASKPEMPDNVARHKQGNADDINFFLVSALQLNGVAVYPAYAKSRSRGTFDMKLMMESQFDSPLIALEVGSRRFKFWQGAIDVPMPADYIDNDLGGTVVFVNESGETDVTFVNAEVPVRDAENSVESLEGTLTLAADGSASGTLKQKATGDVMAELKRTLITAGESGRAKAWSDDIEGTFSDIAVTGTPTFDDPMQVADNMNASSGISLKGVARAVDGGLALKTSVLTDPYNDALDGKERELEVVLPYNADFQSTVTIALPAGYSAPDSLPEPIELRTKGLYYHRTVGREGDNLQIKREFSLNLLNISASIYNRRYAPLIAQIRAADEKELILNKK